MLSPKQFDSNRRLHLAVRSLAHGLLFSMCVAASLAIGGCLVAPVPMTTRVAGVSGGPDHKRLDLKFVEPGKTTRTEVVQNLAWADTGTNDSHLFLGRWFSSGGGWIWAVGGNGGGEGGTHRN